MSDNPLSRKVELDLTNYKAGIAEMNRSIRVIESGFRASAAALGDWSKDATGLEQRIKALNGTIDLQRGKVDGLRAVYEQVAAEQGENSRAAQELEIKLNKETETLNKMETELVSTEDALAQMTEGSGEASEETETLAEAEDDAAESTSSFADRLGDLKTRLGEALGGLKELGGKVLDTVKTGLLAVGAAAVGAVTGLTAMVLSSAASADELVELSDKTGIGIASLQQYQYIAEQTGTSVETITGSLAKLTKNMDAARDGTGPAAEAFKTLGINVTDANGELFDNNVIFGMTLDALQKVGNETERDALAMAIFGKSAQELNPLIDEGIKGLVDMGAEAYELGAVMSESTVRSMADLNDMVAGLKLGFQGWIGQLAGAFLPLFQTVIGAVQGFVSNPEVQAGLQNIIGKVAEFAQKLADAAALLLAGDLKGALGTLFPPEVAEQILNISTQLGIFIGQVVEFVTTHAEAIKNAFIAIGVVLAGAGIVAALSAILNPITLIIAAVGLLAAAWTEDFLGIRTALEGWWNDSGQQIFETLKTWLETNIPIALQTLSDFWTGTLQPALETVWAWIQGTLFPLFSDLVEIYFKQVGENLTTLSDLWTGTLQPALEIVWGFISESILPLLNDLWTLIDTGLSVALEAFAGIWQNVLYPAISDFWGLIKETVKPGLDLLESFWTNTLKPAFEDVTFLDVLSAAFDGLGVAIKAVRDFIQAVITKLVEMGTALPEWAVPGSPMPLDYAFRDLGTTLDDVSKKRLTALQRSFQALGDAPGAMAAAARGGSNTASAGPTNIYQLSANYAYESPRSLMAEVKLRELLAR